MLGREDGPFRQMELLAFGPRKGRNAAHARTLKRRPAPEIVDHRSIAHISHGEAVAEAVFRFPARKTGIGFHDSVLDVGQLQPNPLRERPALARLGPFHVHGAAGADDARCRPHGAQLHAVNGAVGSKLDGVSRAGESAKNNEDGQDHT